MLKYLALMCLLCSVSQASETYEEHYINECNKELTKCMGVIVAKQLSKHLPDEVRIVIDHVRLVTNPTIDLAEYGKIRLNLLHPPSLIFWEIKL